ncbi:MAG: hypothetical protein RI935_154 [Candidatus Parcubacteria bacterium]|jgi:hypothetical protein
MLIRRILTSLLIVQLFLSGFNPEAIVSLFQTVSQKNKHGKIVDKIYLASLNKNVVDTIFSSPSKASAAINPNEKEYMLDVGPVNGSVSANYVYSAFFNPAGSGKTVAIKRLAIRSDTVSTSTASNYVNLSARRISASSLGTQILAADFPQKNASSSNSIAEIRHSGPTVTFSGTADSRILGQPLSGAVGAYYSSRNITFGDQDEKIILQPGEGIAVYQEAAGTVGTSIRVLYEWEETVNAPTPQNEFLFAFPRVEITTTPGYTYNSFFNPSASGKTAIVKRIWFGTETCDAAAVYTNNIILQRISSATGGTLIATSSIPKKHTGGADSFMEFRRTGVTVSTTTAGGVDARIGSVTPCGTTAQATGWKEINFHQNDEKLILQAGQGVALISETAGDLDQLVRMIIEWEEVDAVNTPASQGEYIWASNRIEAAAAANTTHYSFFNPVGSGKNIVIKKLGIQVDADSTGVYVSYSYRRITTASGGTLIAAGALPKKHTGTADSVMEVRWCGAACASAITATYSGTTDANFMTVTSPGAVGQTIGQREMVLGNNEKIILQPGEGVALYNAALGDVDNYVRTFVEWDEEGSAPSSQGEYLIDIGDINGSTATSYNYATFFNPSGSGKTAIIKRMQMRIDSVNTAVYIPMQLRRISAASAGTQIASTSIPKKHTGTVNSVVELRRTGVTATYSGTTDSKLLAVQTQGAVSSAAAAQTAYKEITFDNKEPIILRPGEGVGLYHDTAAGDADFRVKILFEWDEESSAPSTLSEYLYTSGPINQSTTLGYAYTSFFNPIGSGKNYIVKKLGIRANRSGTVVAPVYQPVSIRKIGSATGGTVVATTSVPRKHSGSSTSTADIRTTGPTIGFLQSTSSRVLGIATPGLVNQPSGVFDSDIYYGDELILKEGEGLALYNEQTQGDANVRYRMLLEWQEASNSSSSPQVFSFSVSTSSVYFGTALSAQARYASSTSLLGSDVEVEAHSLIVNTNAINGYTVTLQGDTLTAGSTTITQIGGVNTVSTPGTEQFGVRLTASGGSGVVSSPYALSGFAFDASSSTPSTVATGVGDNATTTFSVRYLVNITPTTEANEYSAALVYIATANF